MRGSSARFGRVVVLAVRQAILGLANAQPALARPVPGPCAPGAGYDPTRDVDHVTDVDILDVQLAAGQLNSCSGETRDFGMPWCLRTPGFNRT